MKSNGDGNNGNESDGKKKRAKKQDAGVAFIADPFGFKTLEVSQAQANENADESSLDEEFEESTSDAEFDSDSEEGDFDLNSEKANQALDRIAEAISEQTEADLAAAVLQEDSPHEQAVGAAEELARQIAEDQALQEQLAQEAQQAEEELAADPELLAALPEGMDLDEVQSCVEALLFLSDKPISMNKLREQLAPAKAPETSPGVSKTEKAASAESDAEADADVEAATSKKPELFPLNVLQEALTQLKDRYNKPWHGIELVEVNGGYQLRTKPIRAPLVKKLSKIQTQRLSSGAMETLAIVAYRQPVMKEEVDKIRGVDSSYFVRGLLDRKLIRISGRSELPGRPMLYSTSDEFLEVFGLKDLDALPPLRELEQMVPASESDKPQDEDPRVRKMRELVSQMNSDKSTSLIYDPREDEKILKEIKERVGSIPTSTPYLEEQKALEKAASQGARLADTDTVAPLAELPAQPELPIAVADAEGVVGVEDLDAAVPPVALDEPLLGADDAKLPT